MLAEAETVEVVEGKVEVEAMVEAYIEAPEVEEAIKAKELSW